MRATFLMPLALVMLAAPVAAGSPDGGAAATRNAAPQAGTGSCRPPKDSALVKVTLKPDSEVIDMIAWYATTTCTGVLVSTGTALAGKKVTILAPEPITIAELRRLFHASLASVGLVAEREGKFLQILDARRARPRP
jgi:hypothetical protein